jgi:hypothetical protein
LDLSRTQRIVDPRFGAVLTAMDVERLRELLNARLCESESQVQVEQVSMQYNFYVPGRNFRAVYRAELVNGNAAETQILYGRIAYANDDAERFAKARRKIAKGRYCQPQLGAGAYHLPEIGMVLWTFPNDPRLKTLRMLMNQDNLRRTLSRLEQAEEWELGRVHPELVRYIPSKRAVLRYEVEWRRPGAQQGEREDLPELRLQRLYGKIYDTEENAQRAFEVLEDLWEASQAQSRFLRVPRPLHCELQLRTVWVSELPGEPLAANAKRVGTSHSARIGRGLALLHLAPVSLQQRVSLEDELESTRENAASIALVYPEFGPPLDRLIGRLATCLPDLPRLPLVPSHGTFKLNHLLSDGKKLSLIDFDSMVLADPMLDVANFISDLHYLEADESLPGGRAQKLARTLLEAYFAQVPWGRRDQVLNWCVASLLIRKQAFKCVKHLHANAEVKIRRVIAKAELLTRRLKS